MDEPNWVVYRPESKRLFVSNGDGKVRTFDSATFAPRHIFEFREKANNLRFDDATGELFVGVGKNYGAISVIDTRADRITMEIPLAAFPKQFELDGDLIYVNVPTANHVAVVSRRQGKVIATWPVRAAKDNIPMGFDRASHRLFIGCAPGKLVVFETPTGKEVATVDIDEDADGVYYDGKRQLIYISCGTGYIDVVRQKDADHYERIERLPTAKGAATSLFSAELDRFFLAVPAQDATPAELRIYRPSASSSP
jgi:DNA-binding beta-propeller fold protein YncE